MRDVIDVLVKCKECGTLQKVELYEGTKIQDYIFIPCIRCNSTKGFRKLKDRPSEDISADDLYDDFREGLL